MILPGDKEKNTNLSRVQEQLYLVYVICVTFTLFLVITNFFISNLVRDAFAKSLVRDAFVKVYSYKLYSNK